jgi:type 1 glutamine amidotransferase
MKALLKRFLPTGMLIALLGIGTMPSSVAAQVQGQIDMKGAEATPVPHPPFNVLVVASRASDHLKMIAAAKPFLEKLGADNHFAVDFTDDTSTINDANLAHYQVFVMLHLAPFDMSHGQQAALRRFILNGGGWVGIHAAGLTGKDFLGPDPKNAYWQWFEEFMGGVTYLPHPAYQKATVLVEDHTHPVTRNLPARFEVSDEWYEFNKSPRDRVRVLATVDESTYRQNKPMGDHPMIWTNERYRRMIYICIGHDPSLLKDDNYAILLRDAILWAGSDPLPKIPMENGRIVYSTSGYSGPGGSVAGAGGVPAGGAGNGALNDGNKLSSRSVSKEQRFRLAVQWAKGRFPGSALSVDPNKDSIIGKGFFNVVVSPTGHYYRMRFSFVIRLTGERPEFRADHFYEKPFEKGITNDYSKIEYRWWDFRQGKPWSPEDRKLFNGLDAAMRAVIDSFTTATISGRGPATSENH